MMLSNVEGTSERLWDATDRGLTACRWDMEIATLLPLAVVVAAKCVRDCTQVRTLRTLAESRVARYFTHQVHLHRGKHLQRRNVATPSLGVSAP